ncbi:hypothetical protein HOP50_20g85740 [Chloropicon primus]|uniref:Uncharacterized protein n=1 Tax=Chloropicon primus TaxID=1764295 RepID=A0A5B8MZM1_9CHLO|nr:hypothetical protein A3770_20p85410 [Chloropicon primus]UPR05224.1 hypothetical protein HOP50_20g85740 [Chloropicon primus]|mmetsp:Transcript_12121/g.33597  ORF Transcript_12121/g.33597 Transcript_12121/m.33597 type:complete len:246 (+) Transcript_12121:269-1006(+)|eukprot:QDZ26023.1 hypothetical protein A3770_20p85410 [Chloropicon primus]
MRWARERPLEVSSPVTRCEPGRRAGGGRPRFRESLCWQRNPGARGGDGCAGPRARRRQQVVTGLGREGGEASFDVEAFVGSGYSTTETAVEALKSFGTTWEVVRAEHIEAMSKVLKTEFAPIRYKLHDEEGAFSSHVRYSSNILGSGWLSASGRVTAEDERTLRVSFDTFWWDAEEEADGVGLRESYYSGDGEKKFVDRFVNAVGNVGFLPAFSLFPVLAYDDEGGRAVFRFPPLQSNIAIERVE